MQIFNYPDNIMESFDKLMLPFESDPEKANLTVIANCSQILESLFESDATIEQTYRMLFTKEKFLDNLLKHLESHSVSTLLRGCVLGIKVKRDENGDLDPNIFYYRLFIYNRILQALLESDELCIVESAAHIIRDLISRRIDILEANRLIKYTILGEKFFTDLVAASCTKVSHC